MSRREPDIREPRIREPRIRSGPTLGTQRNVSVPISIGLPLVVVGAFLLLTASTTGRTLFWILGGATLGLGLMLFASGKTL